MDKTYDPSVVEGKIYQMWENGGYFSPDFSHPDGKPFSIVLPPPNANAPLHMGHAMYTIEDIMVRYHRMKGDPTLWVPGADHAGFETQFVFEKHLAKEGKSRFDYDQETLYRMIWDFVHQNRGTMEQQLRRLGFSLDWSRLIFTLDPNVVSTVYKTFKKLHDEGLVYRELRLVNYCTKCGTGFSDLEVHTEEQDGILYFISYPIQERPGETITVATTRPETMFGDMAVMVHPSDKRYTSYHGMHAIIPIENRAIPIITDTHVDKTFGTGAVKVTPFHDFDDYDVAKRHNLPGKQIIGLNGKLTHVPKELEGLRVKAAREKTLELLGERCVDQKPHQMAVKHCYKCNTILEPLPIPQWYVKVEPLVQKAKEAVKEKTITFTPKRFEKRALQWLTDFHDWNISRQIVWGIRIPAWKCMDCSGDEWIVTEGEAPSSCPKCNGNHLKQETDTFDTWFSSGQWPFATLGACDAKGITTNGQTKSNMETFYPTSVLETGYDILPWWVCRMMMLGLYATDKKPFSTVYLHGLVRDGKGQKMSKSKGNVVNPLDMVEKYGADALRMALVFGTAAGNDQSLSEDKIRGMRNFANKLWNIGRFLNLYTEKLHVTDAEQLNVDIHALPKSQQRMIKDIIQLAETVSKHMEKYRFSDAANILYEFIWHVFADKYIEDSKQSLEKGDVKTLAVLLNIYTIALKLLHPFMPFVTEEIYQKLPGWDGTALIVSSWPGKERREDSKK